MPKSHIRFTLSAGRKEALEKAADDRNSSFEKLIREVVDEWLRARGYLAATPSPPRNDGMGI